MYVIVVGGGKIGYYLTKTLVNEGNYEVLLIEKNPAKVNIFSDRFGSVVQLGDGCEVATLEQAGAARADVVIAVTGADADNLVICQVAKERFGVKKTITRVNNPKNEEIFRSLGVDVTISQTNVILSLIEQMIPDRPMVHLRMLKHAQIEIVETTVSPDSLVVGSRLRDLKLPPNVVISAIMRDGSLQVPNDDTVLMADDEVIAVAQQSSEAALRRLLAGT